MRRDLRQLARAAAAAALIALAGVAAPHGLDLQVDELPDNQVAVFIDERPLTVGQAKLLVALQVGPYRRSEFLFFGMEDLARACRDHAVYTRLAARAAAAGLTITPAERDAINRMQRDLAHRALFRSEVEARLPRPTLEALREIYDAQRDARFRTQERFIVREIMFPVEDPAQDDARGAAANAAWERLEAGEDFLAVMRQLNTEDERNLARIILPEGNTAEPPLVVETLRALGDRRWSRPVRVPAGWVILYRQLYMPASHIPFESTLDVLLEEFKERRRGELRRAFFVDLARDASLFRIHSQNLGSRGDLAFDDDVMLVAGGRQVRRGELMAALGWAVSREVRHNEDFFRRIVLESGIVQEALLDVVAERRQVTADPMLRFALDAQRAVLLGRRLLLGSVAAGATDPGAEEVQAYFEQHRDFLAPPPVASFDRLEVVYTPEQEVPLRAALRGVASLDDAADRIAAVAGMAAPTRDSGTVGLNALPEPHVAALRTAVPPGLARPVFDGGRLTLYHLTDWQEQRGIPADVEAHVRAILRQEKEQALVEARLDEEARGLAVRNMLPVAQ